MIKYNNISVDAGNDECNSDIEELLDRPLIQNPTRHIMEFSNEQSEHYDIRKEIELFQESNIDTKLSKNYLLYAVRMVKM
jgi:hypothetical protein